MKSTTQAAVYKNGSQNGHHLTVEDTMPDSDTSDSFSAEKHHKRSEQCMTAHGMDSAEILQEAANQLEAAEQRLAKAFALAKGKLKLRHPSS